MTSVSMRRLAVNILLLWLVAGLAGLVWWQLQQKEQIAQSTRLLPLSLAEVNSVVVERKQAGFETKLELKRTGEQWQVLQPQKIAANPVKVRQLFTLLDEKVESSYDSAGKDLAAYGLEPAELTVSINGYKLVLGNTNPVSNNRYILNAGKIQLVNEAVYSLLQENWANFVALKLVPESFNLTAVQLPESFAALPQLVSNWKNAEAIRVEAFDPQKLTPEMQSLVLKGATETRKLTIVNLKDEIVLADLAKQLAYVLPISEAAQLFPAKTGLEPAPK
ncbi:DUF4340 domain-containing protein [uncultured Thiothrix sp.]|uniref:DUF4340 domain-containing protein n=1 Tax=uncultured Thiothrix sp. TaxID=223185 RepID=UPI0026288FFB|nr:DUF4340 domain-containing protein [uncultured Thiothrix sp.]